MLKLKVGVIGLGLMGVKHIDSILESKNVELTAICTRNNEKLEKYKKKFNVLGFNNYKDLINSKKIDAIIITTPHYDHTPIAIEAFRNGLHVLTEKPVGVHVNDVNKMLMAYTEVKEKNNNLCFGAVFQQRTLPHWKIIKDMLDTNTLGKLVRTTWIISEWFRTQAYYDQSSWRATWKGEGGGVLINQSSHNLDLYQWFFGLPITILGAVELGKYHNIEVEDGVSAIFQHSNGMVGHFITDTYESPGTNRLEIVGENGKLIYEHNVLTFFKNKTSMLEHIKHCNDGFEKVEYEEIEIKVDSIENFNPYTAVIENFGEAVLEHKNLIAPAAQGVNSLEISNGILLSHFENKKINLPIDGNLYEKTLDDLILKSEK